MHLKSENVVLWLNLLQLILSVRCGDNLALLSGTLRTFQKTICDSEKVSLGCPRGTSISIELAQYEKNGIDGFIQCPIAPTDISTGTDATNNNGTATTQYSNDIANVNHQESCLWPNALQYSLLQTAIEACQKRTHCKFTPAPKSFGGNPCPGVQKIIEYAYKCRPYEFRSKVACENEVIQLVCNPFSRIAIYSANYGRTEYESIQCTQPQGVKEENCQVPFATETVMQLCHGRRRCTISADAQTFGNPCRPDSRMYLKTVYTCVPRKVLRESFDMPLELDEQRSDYENELDEDDGPYKEAIPPAPKLQGAIPRNNNNNSAQQIISSKDTENIEGGYGVPSQSTSTEDHYNEIYYIGLFFGIAVLILLSSIMLVFGRILLHKRNNSTMNSAGASVSELSTTVDAMTKLQSTDAVAVTTMTNDPIDVESTAKAITKATAPTTATTASTTTKTTTTLSMQNNSGLASIDENIDNTSDIDLTTPMAIPSISNRNNQHHMYSTYGPKSYGNLDPNSISYALVTPNIYNTNQTMTLHGALMRPATIQNSQLSPNGSVLYARTLPQNLRTRLPFQSSPSPSPPPPSTLVSSGPQTHHILMPTSASQTLNRHMYPYNTLSRNSSNANASMCVTSTFLPVSIATPNETIVSASRIIPMAPTSILRSTNPTNKRTNDISSGTFLYG